MYQESVIVGLDTETCEGPPFAFQMYSDHQRNLNGIYAVTPDNVTKIFLETLRKRCRPARRYTMYCHNLRFDLPSLFWQCHSEMAKQRDKGFDFTFGPWKIFGVHGNPNFAFLTYGKGDKQINVTLIDSYSWFHVSLKNAAKLVCPTLAKEDAPKDLGKVIFDINDPVFSEYAIRDVEIAFHLGCAIDAFHKTHDIKQSVSVANMAANIFQKHHIREEIVLPNDEHLRLAYSAYHGGKNHLVKDMNGWHRNIACLDIKSAYPHAMTEAPSFTQAKLYSGRSVFRSRGLKTVPEWGVYLCSGLAGEGKWPVIFDHRFKPITGRFENIAIHGFELNEALRTQEVKFSSISGYYYDAEKDAVESALKRFVLEFFLMKDKAATQVERTLYKTLLNSLYGKFIERREREIVLDNGSMGIQLQAGKLYHSPLACGITAHTRAHIHRLEIDYNAIHTATDGIIVPQRRDGVYLPKYLPANGLGSLAIEAEGDAAIVRCKLYIVYVNDPRWINEKTMKSFRMAYEGSDAPAGVSKFAMHGHMGKLWDLEDFVLYGKRNYSALRVNPLRQSIKLGRVPNKFETEQRVLKAPSMSKVFTHPKTERKLTQ